MADGGLAAASAGVTNTYGDGSSNTTKHYYSGKAKASSSKIKQKKKD